MLNFSLKSLTRTKSTSESERLESAGAAASEGTGASTVSQKADSDTAERADVERISEDSSNEREIPETARGHRKMLPWIKRLNLGTTVTVCHLRCRVVWNSNGDLEMLEEKEMAIVCQPELSPWVMLL